MPLPGTYYLDPSWRLLIVWRADDKGRRIGVKQVKPQPNADLATRMKVLGAELVALGFEAPGDPPSIPEPQEPSNLPPV